MREIKKITEMRLESDGIAIQIEESTDESVDLGGVASGETGTQHVRNEIPDECAIIREIWFWRVKWSLKEARFDNFE